MKFFQYIFQTDISATVIMYSFVTVITFVTATLSQKVTNIKTSNGEIEKKIKFKKIWFNFTFIILWFFYALNKTGADINHYIAIFQESSQVNLTEGFVEPGYRLLNITIKFMTANPYTALLIIKTLSLSLLYLSLYNMRQNVHIGISILGFTSLFYFQSFNLIRITLAALICLFSIIMYIKKGNYKYILLSLVAITIHYSALITSITWILYFIYDKWKLKGKMFITLFVSFLVLIFSNFILITLLDKITFLNKYSRYIELDVSAATGVAQYVFYIPLFFCLYFANKYKWNSKIVKIATVWTIEGFIISILGYSIGMVSRLVIYFLFPFVIFIPYFINELRINLNYTRQKSIFLFSYRFTLNTFIFYFFIRYVLYISNSIYIDGIQNFSFIWQ